MQIVKLASRSPVMVVVCGMLVVGMMQFAASLRSTAQADDAKTAALLKAFVTEFVEIKPGTDKFPATFLMGAEDRLYPVEQMRPFAALAPNAKLVVIPSCGHLAPLEAPEVVAEALEDLLAHASSGSTKW